MTLTEREQKYAGTYTVEEVALNKKLYEECTKDILDCNAIERLLEQGADPLGATDVTGFELLRHVYDDIVCDSQEHNSVNLPKVTELFLKHGMDIDNPRIPYDDDDESLNPMWSFAFITNENAICALEMLLDAGLSLQSAREMYDHALFDLLNVTCGDPNTDMFWRYECTWTLKMTMLCASYDHIIENDEGLRDFIGCSYNNYDLHRFRKWNDFNIEFDTSRCDRHKELYRSVIRFFEQDSGKEVWKIGVCLKDGEF